MPTSSSSNVQRVTIPPEARERIAAAFKVLDEDLLPALLAARADELRAVAKMGDGSFAWVVRALGHMAAAPQLVPSFVDAAEDQEDMATYQLLEGYERQLTQFADRVGDSLTLTGAKLYGGARAFYKSTQAAAENNVPGAKTILNDLSDQFATRGARNVPPAEGEEDGAPGRLRPLSTEVGGR